MTVRRFWVLAPLITLVAIGIGLRIVHGRAGDEQVLCDTGTCSVGSGGSWLLTGVVISFGVLGLLGAAWTRRVHQRGRLGPFKKALIPDGGEIVEGLWVIVAAIGAWWLLTRGPEAWVFDPGAPNSWTERLRPQSIFGLSVVPSRFAWFLTGLLLASPFGFSFGSMAAREWYILARRRSLNSPEQTASNEDEPEEDDSADEESTDDD